MTPGIHRILQRWCSLSFRKHSLCLVSQLHDPTPCTIGVTCDPPSDFDIIIGPTLIGRSFQQGSVDSLQIGPSDVNSNAWAADKTSGGEPTVETADKLAPLVQNVVNNASPAQIAQYQALYPGMFPGGNPVPNFFLHLRHTDCVCDADSLVSLGREPITYRQTFGTLR